MVKLKIVNYVRLIAGGMVFLSSLFGYLFHPYWLFLSMFVGLNLFQFGLTNWCPLSYILKKFGVKE